VNQLLAFIAFHPSLWLLCFYYMCAPLLYYGTSISQFILLSLNIIIETSLPISARQSLRYFMYCFRGYFAPHSLWLKYFMVYLVVEYQMGAELTQKNRWQLLSNANILPTAGISNSGY